MNRTTQINDKTQKIPKKNQVLFVSMIRGETDIGVMRKAAVPLIFWYRTAGKFMMNVTSYNTKIKCVPVGKKGVK